MGDDLENLDEMKENNIYWKMNTVITRAQYGSNWKSFGSTKIKSIEGFCKFSYFARVRSGMIDILIEKSLPMPGKAYIRIAGKTIEEKLVNDWTDKSITFNIEYTFNESGFCQSYTKRNDEFEIYCTTVWFGFNDNPFGASLELNKFHKNFDNFFADSSLSDFTVITDKESIPVHKIILALQSPVFSGMFNSNMKENSINQVEIKDIDANIMKIVLKYLYTNDANDLDYDMEILSKILAAADKYEINSLKQNCQAKLAKQINLDTALDILLISGTHNGEDLLKTVTDFMVENKKTIVKTEKFKVMLLERPDMFIEFISKSII